MGRKRDRMSYLPFFIHHFARKSVGSLGDIITLRRSGARREASWTYLGIEPLNRDSNRCRKVLYIVVSVKGAEFGEFYRRGSAPSRNAALGRNSTASKHGATRLFCLSLAAASTTTSAFAAPQLDLAFAFTAFPSVNAYHIIAFPFSMAPFSFARQAQPAAQVRSQSFTLFILQQYRV